MIADRRALIHFFWAAGMTGLLGVGAIVLYARVFRFEGVIVIPVGGSERLVLAPAGEDGWFAAYRNLPLEVLPLADRRAAASVLDRDRLWNARDLGFPLRVIRAEVIRRFPDRHLLEIRRGKEIVRPLIFAGARATLGDFTVAVKHVGPWTGLIRMPGGNPAMVWSIRESPDVPWKQGLFVRPDAPTRLGDTLLMFLPAADESSGRALLPETLPSDTRGRWGVTCKGDTQWIESLQAGSGLTLRDGREITLSGRVSGDPSFLLFLVQPGTGKSPATDPGQLYRVPLNGGPVDIGGDASVTAEAPALAEEGVWAVSWRDNEILAAVYQGGRRTSLDLLVPGGTIPLRNGWMLRFDQALLESVQAGTAEQPVLAAVVALPDRSELVLREGLAVPSGPYYLRFLREEVPPEVRYLLADASKQNVRPISLGPGETVTLRGWAISTHVGAPDPERVALLRARAVWWTGPAAWGLALLLTAAGVRVVLYLLPRREKVPFLKKPRESGN